MSKIWHFCCNPKVIVISIGALIVSVIGLILKWNELSPYLWFIIPIAVLIGCMVICPLAMFVMMRQMNHNGTNTVHK